MADIELFQFAGSHFNEKARWGLDLKGVPHERTSLLPGPHALTMRRVTGGTETPALVDRGEAIAGSMAILEHLERRFPEPPLFPANSAARERALAIVRRWDAEVGPAVRLAKFSDVLESAHAVGMFARHLGRVRRSAYLAMFPVVSRVMKSKMGINAENAAAARETTQAAFDFVATTAGAEGYLVGDSFTVADLTCAALLMPCLALGEWGGPEDLQTEKCKAWLARWVDHPGAAWVREIYRRHRRA